MAKVKFLVLDVDGTLTDGKIYMGQDGELAKAFNVKDGCGILLELPLYDIVPVIITARESQILERRCSELNITELHQGVKDKLEKLTSIVNKYDSSLNAVAYAGDDLPDIPCMEAIRRSGGTVLCPSDAIPEIKALSNYVSSYKAGEGAVRDMIKYLARRINGTNEQKGDIEAVINWIKSNDFSDKVVGTYTLNDRVTYMIQEYDTKVENECKIESHRSHIDIQYIIRGAEWFNLYSTHSLNNSISYDAENDVEYWAEGNISSKTLLSAGSIIVVFPSQPHKGAISDGKKSSVKKVVCKIEVY